jgi:hypothetical protein
LALVSPEPVIRVQAAAVAVKVRAEIKLMLAQTLLAVQQPLSSLVVRVAVASDLDAIARSGLLEDADRDRAAAAAREAFGVVADRIDDLAPGDHIGLDGVSHDRVETQLLAIGRHATFRRLRDGRSTQEPPSSPPTLEAAHG